LLTKISKKLPQYHQWVSNFRTNFKHTIKKYTYLFLFMAIKLQDLICKI